MYVQIIVKELKVCFRIHVFSINVYAYVDRYWHQVEVSTKRVCECVQECVVCQLVCV